VLGAKNFCVSEGHDRRSICAKREHLTTTPETRRAGTACSFPKNKKARPLSPLARKSVARLFCDEIEQLAHTDGCPATFFFRGMLRAVGKLDGF
jgi:hypothetical protein